MTYETGLKIDKLLAEADVFNSRGAREKEFHDYPDNSKEELELLLSHHKEDLEEYINRGDDQEDIDRVKEDIREIEVELQGR